MDDLLNDEYYMRLALSEAEKAGEEGEIPIGAVIVHKNTILGKGYNLTKRLRDVTAHAEMLALTAACQKLDSKYLPECTLYVTIEPCPMCAGALYWTHIGRIVFGARDMKKGYQLFQPSLLHPRTEVKSGVLASETGNIVSSFFSAKRL